MGCAQNLPQTGFASQILFFVFFFLKKKTNNKYVRCVVNAFRDLGAILIPSMSCLNAISSTAVIENVTTTAESEVGGGRSTS